MVANRLSQLLHLLKLVGFIPEGVAEDLRRAKKAEKLKDGQIIQELVDELADEECDPLTDEFLVASVGNHAGFFARQAGSKQGIPACCKKELCLVDQLEMEAVGADLAPFEALINLIDRGSLGCSYDAVYVQTILCCYPF